MDIKSNQNFNIFLWLNSYLMFELKKIKHAQMQKQNTKRKIKSKYFVNV